MSEAVKEVVEEGINATELQELLLDLQYSLQETVPHNPIIGSFFKLGKIHVSNQVSTAGVNVDKEGNVFMLFNPKFAAEIMKKEHHTKILEFVLMHEAMHVVLDHIKRRKHRQPFIWNIACDAIVNTTVFNIFGDRFKAFPNPSPTTFTIKKIDEKGNIVPDLVTVPANSHFVIVKDRDINQHCVDEMNEFIEVLVHPSSVKETIDTCYYLCAEELYEKLLKKCESLKASGLGTLDDHGGWEKSEEDGEGEEKTSAQEMAEDQLKESMKEALTRSIKEDPGASGRMADKSPCGEFRELGINITPRKLPWDKMLRNFIASRIDEHIEEVWHNPNRKLRQFWPSVILPNEFEIEDKQKLLVLIAVDTSGSMTGELLKKVQNVLAAFPADKVDYTAISFDTDIYPIDTDITKVTSFRGGGGTSFQDVADHAHKLPLHPDCVIMITDGCDSTPKLLKPDNWLWLLVPGGRSPGGKIGKVLEMN